MESVSVVSAWTQAIAGLFYQFPFLQLMFDLTIKSIILLSVFVIIDLVIGRRINSASRHLFWFSAFGSLMLLPFVPSAIGLFQSAGQGFAAPTALFELTVYASHLAPYSSAGGSYAFWLVLAIYLIPAVLMLFRLTLAARSLIRISRHADVIVSGTMIERMQTLRQSLNISRPVSLGVSAEISSPMSFGLMRPRIVLPAQARDWSQSVITDVLLHELCHIKRFDWLSTLLAYVVTSIFWMNPLVWLAFRRLREECENSCDTAVLHAGRSDTVYAESLLSVACSCIKAHRDKSENPFNRNNRNSNPLLQAMLDQSTLKIRISRVLEENKMKASELKKEIRKTLGAVLLMSTAVLGVLGSTQVLLAQQQPDPANRAIQREMIPLNTIQPVYPRAAADESIEGWVHVHFTVSADGTVYEDSVGIVEAQPADIFNRSAINAIRQFLFSPRIVDGEAVDVPNVQYVFRYRMTEEPAGADQN